MIEEALIPLKIVLPWPVKELHPNSRAHWGQVSRAKKSYREACMVMASQAGAPSWAADLTKFDKLGVHMDFYPPNKHARDEDGCIASMKAGLDGLSDALGIDDKHFRLTHTLHEQIGGFVRVTVTT